MKTNELDYNLPKQLIAQQALPNRAESRLLVIDRQSDTLQHRQFSDIVDYLRPGDCLVLNESKVIPARFFAQRSTGGKIEGLFLELTPDGNWQVLLKNAARLKIGETIKLYPESASKPTPDAPGLEIIERQGQGQWIIRCNSSEQYITVLEKFGVTPLPPYINRKADTADLSRYQTVYASQPGSVAAPTAGLHFTPDLLQQIQDMGVRTAKVTLHVGLDTFKPIDAENLEEHPMHSERYAIDQANADIINQTKLSAGRVIAVGSTSVRVLETVAQQQPIQAQQGATRLFITPGYKFKAVDAIITNFHLPHTTLLAMVCAFGGKERVLQAYNQAVKEKYRFFSYGDATLLL